MSHITIKINGEEKQIAENTTLTKLIEDLELDLKKIAIEKDLEIINPDEFSKTILTQGTSLEIVHFIGGG